MGLNNSIELLLLIRHFDIKTWVFVLPRRLRIVNFLVLASYFVIFLNLLLVEVSTLSTLLFYHNLIN
jgi:hypothetical protein